MEEKNANTIIEVLAETVRSLRVDVLILKSENERLREKIAKYEQPLEKAGINNA